MCLTLETKPPIKFRNTSFPLTDSATTSIDFIPFNPPELIPNSTDVSRFSFFPHLLTTQRSSRYISYVRSPSYPDVTVVG